MESRRKSIIQLTIKSSRNFGSTFISHVYKSYRIWNNDGESRDNTIFALLLLLLFDLDKREYIRFDTESTLHIACKIV